MDPDDDDLDKLRAARDVAFEHPDDATIADAYDELLDQMSEAWIYSNFPEMYQELLDRLKKSSKINTATRSRGPNERSSAITADHNAAKQQVGWLYKIANNRLLGLLS